MSKLDQYIGKLLRDDDALKDFLVDPIKAAEDQHGLTKAQRAVLRRVVANLSNNSTNGFGIVRSLNSYRRSIRMLQNVLHLERGTSMAAAAADSSDNTHYVYVYYNGIPDDPSANNPYAFYMYFKGTGDTIGEVMDNAVDPYGNSLSALTGTVTNDDGTFVTSFEVPSPWPYPGTYEVDLPQSLSDTDPFWFYSVNGQAILGNYVNPDAYYGDAGYSYVNFLSLIHI